MTFLQRRAFLGAGSLAATLALLPGTARAAVASLSPNATAILTRVVDVLLPADRTPAASALGTPQYVIAGLLARGDDGGAALEAGLGAIDQLALARFGSGFLALDAARQTQVVDVVATDPAFAALWGGIRSLAVFHYYAQPVAWLDIGLPGPSIDCGGHPDPDAEACRPRGA
ncbi:gluconate 2-dehydrogenase subunit 3 family protein [Derxia gummosa]|uniref:Gluconate 2-dehydrogenase subunit 3 family protein n=1 Tax=Derxia gummosa DSM 723 TaxID=1121388 RepID=A0A8B6X583_9BURK|nr:gluconate 2-dehydrogenase subunit 3 family protein [Derxia gummosa]